MGKAACFRLPVWRDRDIRAGCSPSDPKRSVQEAFPICHPGPPRQTFLPSEKRTKRNEAGQCHRESFCHTCEFIVEPRRGRSVLGKGGFCSKDKERTLDSP